MKKLTPTMDTLYVVGGNVVDAAKKAEQLASFLPKHGMIWVIGPWEGNWPFSEKK